MNNGIKIQGSNNNHYCEKAETACELNHNIPHVPGYTINIYITFILATSLIHFAHNHMKKPHKRTPFWEQISLNKFHIHVYTKSIHMYIHSSCTCIYKVHTHVYTHTVKWLIIGDYLLSEIGEFKKFTKIILLQKLETTKLIICQIVIFEKLPNNNTRQIFSSYSK